MPSCPAKAPPLLGKVIAGRYRVVQLLASGGIGDVYLGEPIAPGRRTGPEARRRVAVKVLRDEHRDRPELSTRFRREAEAAARVRHDNVIGVIEMPSEKDGVLCFVTELLVGLDLADTLAYSGALGAARSAKIACGAADGLAAAHEAGVVHRDVKPENILVRPDGSAVLTDLGLARSALFRTLTRHDVAVGTLAYMSPEQCVGRPLDGRSDLWSLGVTLHEAITGRRAFDARHELELVYVIHNVDPPLPSALVAGVPPVLEAVIVRCLARDPEARFAAAGQIEEALGPLARES